MYVFHVTFSRAASWVAVKGLFHSEGKQRACFRSEAHEQFTQALPFPLYESYNKSGLHLIRSWHCGII